MVFGVEHVSEIIRMSKEKNKEVEEDIKRLQNQITDLQTQISNIKNTDEYLLNQEIIEYFEEKLNEKKKK